MIARVTWLPVGHIAHGYRRVFAITEGDVLRHVVNFTPMPYEQVFAVREATDGPKTSDPSLLWGLSAIALLVADGTLLASENPERSDDGYVQLRPPLVGPPNLLPVPAVESAIAKGEIQFVGQEDGGWIWQTSM